MAGIGLHMTGYILNRGFTELSTSQRGVRFFGVVWTQTFANLPHPLNIAWLSLVCRDSEERSLAMASQVYPFAFDLRRALTPQNYHECQHCSHLRRAIISSGR